MGEVLKFPTPERSPSTEAIAESVERAQELMTELTKYHDVDLYGAAATKGLSDTRALSAELTAVLDTIPDAEREARGLRPRSPYEKLIRVEQVDTVFEFPTSEKSGYADVLGYEHADIPEGEKIPVDAQQEPSPGWRQAA